MKLINKADIVRALDWPGAISAIREGHRGERPLTQDILLADGAFNLFGRAVILPGHGAGMKLASIYPPNAQQIPPRPAEDAAFILIDEGTKSVVAVFDGPEITRWKTAGDSALASQILSREESETLLIVGAGPIAQALAEAHVFARPGLKNLLLWNRTTERADALRGALQDLNVEIRVVEDLDSTVSEADIIATATGSKEPLIKGELLKPGTHVDLVGSYSVEMREADCETMRRATIYVDNLDTAVEHTGEITTAIKSGAITTSRIQTDLFGLVASVPSRRSSDITVFKNAGGAHFDLLVCEYTLKKLTASQSCPQS